MSIVIRLAKLLALSVMAGLLMGNSARSQELSRPLTIADCPAGTVLAVQDTAEPFLPAKVPDPNAGYGESNQETPAAIQQAEQEQAAAPRRFVTGCVNPQQPQQQ